MKSVREALEELKTAKEPKQCSKCKEYKSKTEFSKTLANKDGLSYYCKPCDRAYQLEKREKASSRPCVDCGKEPRIKAQTVCKPCQKKRIALGKYNITPERYDELHTDPACACCGRAPEEIGGKHPMAIDHNHGTGEVRDLICRYCNAALGMLYEDITRVRQLGVYILKHEHDVCTQEEHK